MADHSPATPEKSRNYDAFGRSFFYACGWVFKASLVADFVYQMVDREKANAEYYSHPVASVFQVLICVFSIGFCHYVNDSQGGA